MHSARDFLRSQYPHLTPLCSFFSIATNSSPYRVELTNRATRRQLRQEAGPSESPRDQRLDWRGGECRPIESSRKSRDLAYPASVVFQVRSDSGLSAHGLFRKYRLSRFRVDLSEIRSRVELLH